jgi:predicted transcriptional regulator
MALSRNREPTLVPRAGRPWVEQLPKSLRPSPWLWHHEHMAKQPLTVELDEDVILAAQAEASRKGQSEAAVVEQALREHLAHQGSVTDEVWLRNRDAGLGEEEALTLAYDELKAMRHEWGDSGKAVS